ncbi:hypothetical protein HFRIS_013014 [Herbaspirillum frisingense GSF30]|uniref:Uncharacterized protein n=1 Tax=Herbaspirillum frisingense GSF30 TaxID=864073 RepID=A0AAI9IE39_9BURK|nr:hypothetical protein HFRIS_013014 [Herbaspirillum frisingense GSF30]
MHRKDSRLLVRPAGRVIHVTSSRDVFQCTRHQNRIGTSLNVAHINRDGRLAMGMDLLMLVLLVLAITKV